MSLRTNPTAARRLRASLALVVPLALGACVSTNEGAGTKNDVGPAESSEIRSDRPPSAQTLHSMAKIMVSRKRDGEAEAILVKLVAVHPEYLPAYTDLADLYLRNNRPDSAAEVLKAGSHVAPKDAVMLNNFGMCRLMEGKYDEALECFTAAAGGYPIDARARGNMAVALGMLGRYDESLSIYMQLVGPAAAHYNLGVICEARKDEERAQQEFAQADSMRSSKSR